VFALISTAAQIRADISVTLGRLIIFGFQTLFLEERMKIS